MFRSGGPHPHGVIKRRDGRMEGPYPSCLPMACSSWRQKASSLDNATSESHLGSGDQLSPDTKLVAP